MSPKQSNHRRQSITPERPCGHPPFFFVGACGAGALDGPGWASMRLRAISNCSSVSSPRAVIAASSAKVFEPSVIISPKMILGLKHEDPRMFKGYSGVGQLPSYQAG
ncbi:hypothetical protein RHECIAT_CH0000859 [Rhizobium etli CIAT 652]|uniref:Uncharacterized protein n=1 Tax=Rhizobium etli (strain CIAT 652) TaxID=491916 RepID=B3PQK0_RHIE6|nr:hypothetical protein RHECIAT_CH0000859 [Rhizobium etli CIAT 652]